MVIVGFIVKLLQEKPLIRYGFLKMKKENFVMLINAIIKHNEEKRRLEKALGPFFDCHLIAKIGDALSDDVMSALEGEMGDDIRPPFGSTISWWLYDAPKAGKTDSAWIEDDGVRYDLPDAEALYSYLKIAKDKKNNE